jgi:hypothetical protein
MCIVCRDGAEDAQGSATMTGPYAVEVLKLSCARTVLVPSTYMAGLCDFGIQKQQLAILLNGCWPYQQVLITSICTVPMRA